jgi:hypothetical protein
MSRVRFWLISGLAASALLIGTASMNAQAPRFSSLYTNLKTDCRGTVKLKKGEEPTGDIPLKCKGYGGYEVRIDYSAASSSLRLQPVRGQWDESINLGMQPLDYDQKHKIEWRVANGKPFAVIYRIDKSKGDQPEEMWSAANKTGESLVIKGLKGFEHIDLEIDANTPGANLKAREMADQAYRRKN